MLITIKLLRRLNACRKQQQLFMEYYPHGVEVTEDNLRLAAVRGLTIAWLRNRLPVEQQRKFGRLRDVHGVFYEGQYSYEADLAKVCAEITEKQLLPAEEHPE